MEAIIPLVALFSLGLLAIRFGADSRPAIRSDEHRLADAGVMWPSEPIATSAAPASRPDTPQVRHVLWTSAPTARRGSSVPTFPTLEALDRAREPGSDPFATDPNADRLEGRARQLTDEYWSEWVWLIGRVGRDRFDLVCNALDHERHVLRDARQRVEDVEEMLMEMAAEATRSRVWAGIHSPVDCELGIVGDETVGRLVTLRAQADEAGP